MAIYEYPCEECGEMMTARRRDKRFCSAECRGKKYYRENREVMQIRLDAWLEVNPEKRKEYNARYTERHPREKKTYERICEGCGETFIAMRKDKRACSRQCKNNFHSRRIKRWIRHGCDWNEEFGRLWQAQDGKCYLCENPLDSDQAACHVDHDHSCCPPGRSCAKCRRGLAHPLCNWIVGYAEDDPDRLRRIADNLEIASALVRERLRGHTP